MLGYHVDGYSKLVLRLVGVVVGVGVVSSVDGREWAE